MTLPTPNSPTLAPTRITLERFTQLLKSKNSPATPDSRIVYDVLVDEGVDASFALAQFRVESQYGTAGYARVTGSWGNMLYDRSLCKNASGMYAPGNGYVYATYEDYFSAITDYCYYIHNYAEVRKLETIYEATAEWIGKAPGSSGHQNYVTTIIDDMIEYEYPEGTWYETGDKMIYTNSGIVNGSIKKKIWLAYGTPLYRGTNGDLLKKYSGASSYAFFLGLVNGAPDWGMILVKTSSADYSGTLLYIKNPDLTKVITV